MTKIFPSNQKESDSRKTPPAPNDEPYDMNRLDPETERELREAFTSFDKDGGGEIDKFELQSLLESMGRKCSEDEIDQIMAAVDDDGSGSISFSEFKLIASEKIEGENAYDPEEMRTIFRFFDRNNDGLITFDELNYVLNTKMKLGFPKKDVEQMMLYADLTGDKNTINEDEFYTLLTTKELKTPRYMRIQNEKENKSKRALWGRFTKKKKPRPKTVPAAEPQRCLARTAPVQPSASTPVHQKRNHGSFFLTQVPISEEDTLHSR